MSDGPEHTCALTEDGEAVCWGWNTFGQTDAPPGRYAAIAAGGPFTCALTGDGEAVCWGARIYGRRGSGDWAAEPYLPPGRYKAISAGNSADDDMHLCALTEDGEAICRNSFHRDQQESPPGPFTAISTGGGHRTCALTGDGEAVCWSGDGVRHDDVPAGRFVAISAGRTLACALTGDGEAVC